MTESERREKRNAYMREYRRVNRERTTQLEYKSKAKNKEKYEAIAKASYERNREKILAKLKAAYVKRPPRPKKPKEYHLERNRRWHHDNREKRLAQKREWAAANKEKATYYAAKRRAVIANATPVWANEFFIEEIYDLAQRRTAATGLQWEVDHLVPLINRKVCGFHVEHNLRVVLMHENRTQSNRHWPDQP